MSASKHPPVSPSCSPVPRRWSPTEGMQGVWHGSVNMPQQASSSVLLVFALCTSASLGFFCPNLIAKKSLHLDVLTKSQSVCVGGKLGAA